MELRVDLKRYSLWKFETNASRFQMESEPTATVAQSEIASGAVTLASAAYGPWANSESLQNGNAPTIRTEGDKADVSAVPTKQDNGTYTTVVEEHASSVKKC